MLAVVLACTPYFFAYVLKRGPADIGAYLLVFSLSGMAMVPALRWLIGKLDKKVAYMALLFGYALAMASWYFWREGEPEAFFYARAVVIGVFSVGTLICGMSLLPDTMEYDRLASGRSREGVMSGVFTLVEKMSGAAGPLIIGLLLQSMGLIASRDPTVVQPESALHAIQIGMSLIPAAITLMCIPVLAAYRLNAGALADARRAAQ